MLLGVHSMSLSGNGPIPAFSQQELTPMSSIRDVKAVLVIGCPCHGGWEGTGNLSPMYLRWYGHSSRARILKKARPSVADRSMWHPLEAQPQSPTSSESRLEAPYPGSCGQRDL